MNIFPLQVIELEKVNSTNEYAGNLLHSHEIKEGTVIWAREQFAGKGQRDKTWESEPGRNLTFSLILHPAFLLPEKQFLLNEAIALGVLDLAEMYVPKEKISIKWPNDIYAGERKLGGILINNIISGMIFETAVAGIGLNINQTEFSPLIPNPVSIKVLTDRETDLRSILITLCESIESRYRLMHSGYKALHDDYCKNLLGFDTWRNYLTGDEEIEGKITGVTESGRLTVENRESKILEFDHHQIEYLL